MKNIAHSLLAWIRTKTPSPLPELVGHIRAIAREVVRTHEYQHPHETLIARVPKWRIQAVPVNFNPAHPIGGEK